MNSYRGHAIVLLCLAILVAVSISNSPPPNTIPVITMKTGQDASCEDITREFICELSWNHFDGMWLEGWTNWSTMHTIFEWCDSTGMYVVSAPAWLQVLGIWPPDRWARYDQDTLQSDSAFFQPDSAFEEIDSVRYATTMLDSITVRCCSLACDVEDFDCIWYYDIFNEAPSWQLRRMLNKQVTLPYDDYFPNVFTQDTSMSTVAADGVFSWLKWESHDIDSVHSISITFGSFHTIENWAEYGDTLGTFHTQATSVRAFINTMYQAYSDSPPYPDPMENSPEFLGFNAYPIRLVGIDYQSDSSYTSALGDSLDTWMLGHYETIMDSTFIPAWENDCFPIHYHPQAFGRTGGLAIWDTIPDPDTLNYLSYNYRIPSPAEFRMLCNLGLLRQAKGVFPYSIRSYSEVAGGVVNHHDTGLLDEDLIPFDAPYEEWVYRERPSSDFYYAPPDSIPPWTDIEGDDFDPLYHLHDRPINVPGSQRNLENYLLWKFKPYARLWNSMRETMGEIATVAPELAALWWWEGHEYDAEIVSGDSINLPLLYITPEIRVFTDTTESVAYLFYLNRHCRNTRLPFEIIVDEDSFPGGVITEYLLDHSRRFIIPVTDSSGVYRWRDTLYAGQGRLVEFVDSPVPVDIRITAPDVMARYPGVAVDIRDFEFTSGDTVVIIADFFNMGTSSEDDVIVSCVDLSDGSAEIGRDTIDFHGLSTSGWTTDSDRARFQWATVPTDIGVHVMEISIVCTISGESDTLDNTTHAVFLIEPRDYATKVLHDPWDMTEAASSPPDWHTNDIDSLLGYASFSDSISGMFEGTIDDDSLDTNRMYLHIPDRPSSDWIQGRLYDQLCFAARVGRASFLTVGWTDSTGTADSVSFSSAADTLTADWMEYGPFDLDLSFPMSKIKELWLRFDPLSGNVSMPVRIGWIRLTE